MVFIQPRKYKSLTFAWMFEMQVLLDIGIRTLWIDASLHSSLRPLCETVVSSYRIEVLPHGIEVAWSIEIVLHYQSHNSC